MRVSETPAPCEAPGTAQLGPGSTLTVEWTAPVPSAGTQQLLGQGLCWALGCTGQQASREPCPKVWGDK